MLSGPGVCAGLRFAARQNRLHHPAEGGPRQSEVGHFCQANLGHFWKVLKGRICQHLAAHRLRCCRPQMCGTASTLIQSGNSASPRPEPDSPSFPTPP